MTTKKKKADAMRCISCGSVCCSEGHGVRTLEGGPDVGDVGVGYCVRQMVVAAVCWDVSRELLLPNTNVGLLAGVESRSSDIRMHKKGQRCFRERPSGR